MLRGIIWWPRDSACWRQIRGILLTIWLGLPGQASAAPPEIIELQRLDFGTVAIKTNEASSSLTVSPQGTASYGTAFVYIAATTPGRYRLSGFPAYTDLTLTLPSFPISLGGTGSGQLLTLTAPVSLPLALRTDQNGEVEFNLGATLSTSGNGPMYEDGVYLGRPMLTLDFLADGIPVQSFLEIDVQTEVRTNLQLAEIDRLHFGRFVAISSNTDQASMTMSPTGALSYSNAGNARVLRFGGETPGRYRVSAGAAFATVNLTLPTETVFLTHQSQASDVARFLVDSFTTQPSAALQLDAQGALEFRLGATLRTEQTAKRYQDGEYSGVFSLSVDY